MTTPITQPKKKPIFLTIVALVILLTGAIFSLGGSLVMLGVSLISIALPAAFDIGANLYSSMSTTTMLAVFGCMTIPGIVFLFQKLSDRYKEKTPDPEDPYNNHVPFSRMMVPNIALSVTILLLLIVYLLSTRFDFMVWVLPFLQIPAVLIPIFWIYQFATRNLYPRPTKRIWIALGLDLTLQPTLAMILELGLILVMMIPVIAWLALNPEILTDLITTFEQLPDLQFMTMEELETMAGNWLGNAWVLLFVQLFVAVFVPLLEELIKPLLVWRWIKRPLKPIDGFWLGLIGGATFALYENFGNLGTISMIDDWYFLLLARMGTSFLHMGTAALMGWGLMKTFTDHKWLRAVGVYLLCTALHGAWNFFALIQGFAALPMENEPGIFLLTPIALPMLILLGAVCAAIVAFGANRIQQAEKTQSTPTIENSEAL